MAALRDVGARVFQISGTGLPDLLCFHGRQCFLVEVKNRKKGDAGPASYLSEPQKIFHREAKANGWPVFLVFGPDEVLEVINIVRKRV